MHGCVNAGEGTARSKGQRASRSAKTDKAQKTCTKCRQHAKMRESRCARATWRGRWRSSQQKKTCIALCGNGHGTKTCAHCRKHAERSPLLDVCTGVLMHERKSRKRKCAPLFAETDKEQRHMHNATNTPKKKKSPYLDQRRAQRLHIA